MAIHVALNHRTHYRYDRRVALSAARRSAAAGAALPHADPQLLAEGRARAALHQLAAGSARQLPRAVVFPEKTRELLDRSRSASPRCRSSIRSTSSSSRPPRRSRSRTSRGCSKELAPYLETSADGAPRLQRVRPHDRSPPATDDRFPRRSQPPAVARRSRYVIRLEPGVQTPDETLGSRRGSCRDTGWLLVQILRHLGLAARFVSGYLIQLDARRQIARRPVGRRRRTSPTCTPGPRCTCRAPAGSGSIRHRTAGRRRPHPARGDARPVQRRAGHRRASTSARSSSTTRCTCGGFTKSPRVTKPVHRGAMAAIEALGAQVDARSAAPATSADDGRRADVRVDRRHGRRRMEHRGARPAASASWPAMLVRRLKQQFAPGGLLHFGQGKWYPGESLPRWALGCWWRRDGVPIWNDDALHRRRDGRLRARRGAREAVRHDAGRRAGASTRASRIPAYEDVWYYLWRERRLPVNVDPLKSQLKDEEERARLARIFEQGLDRVVGYVLPLRRTRTPNPGAALGERALVPAARASVPDSRRFADRLSVAARLAAVGDAPDVSLHLRAGSSVERPPLAAAAACTVERDVRRAVRARRAPRRSRAQPPPKRGESAAGVVRTALCVEPRDGRLHVFMPPVERTEDYLDLMAAIESTAAALSMPVIIEGEQPPRRSAAQSLQGHARPGRDRSQPAPGAQLGRAGRARPRRCTRRRASRGSAPRSSCSTAATPAPAAATTSSSAARRRPTARSCAGPICCAAWSATGTTIRRCRTCSRACSSARRASIRAWTRRATMRCTSWRSRSRRFASERHCPPWLVDRVFRNLLVDVTGNTHRAEFCIDKLYAPETSSGRQGLVELRAFEMPPHARMSLAQQLLLRALIASVLEEPVQSAAGALGHGAARSLHAAAFRRAGLRRRDGRSAAQPGIRCSQSGSRRTSSSDSRCTARSRGAACSSNCGRRSSRGM